MNLDYGKDFTIVRVVGVFIACMVLYRAYELYESYLPGSHTVISTGQAISLIISVIIVIYCFTMYWRVEFCYDRIITNYGSWFWRKQKVFTPILNIQVKVDFVEVKNGPDRAYISVCVQPDGRDRPYPAASLYQLRNSLFMKSHYVKKHQEEILKFQSDMDRLVSLYPDVPMVLDDKVVDFYSAITSQAFRWGKC